MNYEKEFTEKETGSYSKHCDIESEQQWHITQSSKLACGSVTG